MLPGRVARQGRVMGEQELPNNVKVFLTEHIESVLQLELLLLLQSNDRRQWTAADLAQELRIDRAWAAGQLDDLCARGLLRCDLGPPAAYQYAPRSGDLDRIVVDVAATYAARRVTVIGLIFSKPIDRIRTFADAFRIRKDPKDGKENPGG
jgi:hypothetical protein